MEKIIGAHAVLRNNIERSQIHFMCFLPNVISCNMLIWLFCWYLAGMGQVLTNRCDVLSIFFNIYKENSLFLEFFFFFGLCMLAVPGDVFCSVLPGTYEATRKPRGHLPCLSQAPRSPSLLPSFIFQSSPIPHGFAISRVFFVIRMRMGRNRAFACWWTRICFQYVSVECVF